MAVDAKSEKKGPAKKPVKSYFEDKTKQDELSELLEDFRRRPGLYLGILGFVLFCVVVGFLYTAYRTAAREDLMTAYAKALDKTEPAEKLAALEPLVQKGGGGADEVLYVAAETAYDAGEFDKAKSIFEKLRSEHPKSTFVPDAVEGLGYIAENAKDYDAALAYYREVQEKWPDSFTARRQPLNVAKLEERRGNLEAAVAAYREQLQVFPGSSVAQDADTALNRLATTNPELFPTPEKSALPVDGTGAAAATPETPGAAPSLDLQLTPPTAEPQPGNLELKLDIPGATPAPSSEAAAPAPAAETPPAEAVPASPDAPAAPPVEPGTQQ